MTIKVQRDWAEIRHELWEALDGYEGSPLDLVEAAKLDYFSVRRYKKSAPKNQTKSALLLCIYFGIDIFNKDKGMQIILDAIADTWDGSEEHAQQLAGLIKWSKCIPGGAKESVK